MGVTVVLAEESGEQAAAREIFDEVWPTAGDGTQVTPNLLRAILHAGGYCSVARDDVTGQAVGAAFGFLGQDETGEIYLHSHMAAALAGHRDRGIGTMLKRHQRDWALGRGVPVVSWTFDPLVRRNARLNLINLGVRVTAFHPDFYGVMTDAINAGDRTDRLVAWWEVDSVRARDAAAGGLMPLSAARLREGGAVDLVGAGNLVGAGDASAGADVGLVALPEDIVAVRRSDPADALAWRHAVRDVLMAAYQRGQQVVGFTDESSYVVADPSRVLF